MDGMVGARGPSRRRAGTDRRELVRAVRSAPPAPTRSSARTTASSATTTSRSLDGRRARPRRARALALRRAARARRGARARVHARRTATPRSTSSSTTCRSSSTRSRWRSTATISACISSCTRSCACAARADGALLGMAPTTTPARDRRPTHVLLESWTHIEIDRETSAEILDSVRAELDLGARTTCAPRRRDWLKMLDAVQRVAAELEHAAAAVSTPTSSPKARRCSQWLADQHFTFLGYRAYDLARRRLAAARFRGTGLGLLRDAPEEAVGELRRAAAPRCAPRRARRTLLVLTKANARSTVHRPTYLDYVGVKRYDAARRGHRRAPLPRPLHVERVHGQPVRRSRCCAARSRPSSSAPGSCPRATTRRISSRSSRRTRATTCSRSTSTTCSRSRWRSCGCRNGAGCGCSCTASRTAGSCRASSSSPATATRPQVREHIARPARRRVRRDEPRVEHPAVGVGARPPALRAARRPARPAHASTSPRSRTRSSRPRPARGSTTSATRSTAARGEETGLDVAAGVGRRVPGRVPGRLRRGRGARRPRRSSNALGDRDAARGAAHRSRAGHLDLKLYGIGAQPSLSEVLPRLSNMGVIVDDEHPYEIDAAAASSRAG